MNWLTDIVRPKIKKTTPKEISDDLWVKCPQCGQMLFSKELKQSLYVCTKCGHHLRLYVDKRLKQLFDDGIYSVMVLPQVKEDPLKFRDTQRYSDRLRVYRKKTGGNDAIKVGTGKVAGIDTVVAAMDFSFMGGSMGTAVGEGIVAAAQYAYDNDCPLIIASASGGARMQEGILSLMQMAKTCGALSRHAEAKLPYFAILTNPTYGGVSASFAAVGDVILAEPKAMIGFAGPRVIQETTNAKLPEGFQTAEFLLEKGLVDRVVERKNLKKELGLLLEFFKK
jgi:acetyl-CoA carboxylase carboxyl transferase subunit beta